MKNNNFETVRDFSKNQNNILKLPDFEEYINLQNELVKKSTKQWTYFILEIEKKEFIKIGKTNNIHNRLSELQSSNARNLKIVFLTKDYTEGEMHEKFHLLKKRGEWFRYTNEIKEFLKTEYLKDLGE